MEEQKRESPEQEEKRREAYVEKMQAQLKEWEAKISELQAKVDKAKATEKIKYYESISGLEKKRELVREKLETLRDVSEGAGDDLVTGLKFAMEDLKDAVSLAVSRFTEKK
jgi:multidrug resistance efflux pump